MLRSNKFFVAVLAVVFAAVAFSAWAASGPEEILNQLVKTYMEKRFGETMKYIAALDPKVDKVNVNLKKGILESEAEGSLKLFGRRYKAKYGQTWRDKNNCAYISDIDFETEVNPTVSDLGERAMEAMYARKCESDKNLANAIKAAWLVKALVP